MKIVCYLIIVSILFTSCFSYRKTISDPGELKLEKRYKFKFADGSVQRKKIKIPIDSIKVKYFFEKPKTFAIADAVEIKEGKFSILKSIGFAVVWTLVTTAVLTIVALASFDLNIGEIQSPN